MKRWKGRWLMVVAMLHSVVAKMAFHDVFQAIFARGVFDAVGHDPVTGRAVWFALFGGGLFIVGLAVDQLEYHCPDAGVRPLGGALLVLVAVGILLMPVSGFWFALPPGVAMVWRKSCRSSDKGLIRES